MILSRFLSSLLYLACVLITARVYSFVFAPAPRPSLEHARRESSSSCWKASHSHSWDHVRMRGPYSARYKSAGSLGMSNLDEAESSFAAKDMQERTHAELQALISEHNIIAFIKGTRTMPQCGFSGTLVNILQSLSVPFETVDVLADDRIRQGIKDFSDWPTIPQLYLAGEFVGGSDIVIELYKSGELQEMIEVAAAS